MSRISAEEKLLRQVIKMRWAEKGYPVKQEPPACPNCSIMIDIADSLIKADFRDIEISGKPFLVAEAYCPNCFKKIDAEVFTNN